MPSLPQTHGPIRHTISLESAERNDRKRHHQNWWCWFYHLSAQTVFGADGNDIIDIGTVGLTATLTAIINIKSGAGASGASALVTGIVGGPGGSQFTAVVTASGGAGASAATGVATGILTADAGIPPLLSFSSKVRLATTQSCLARHWPRLPRHTSVVVKAMTTSVVVLSSTMNTLQVPAP